MRRVLVRVATAIILVGIVAGLLYAAGTNRSPLGNTPAAPPRGGSVVDGIPDDSHSLIPYIGGSAASSALWASLWDEDQQGRYRAGIAADVPSLDDRTISADLTTWTFHLRPGLKWSDGTPETAEDCAWTFTLFFADPAFGFGSFLPFASATASDPQTVVLTWKHPFARTNWWLSTPYSTCLQKATYSQIAPADFLKPEHFAPTVSNGPFTFKEWVHGDHLTVVRNPYYYKGPAKPYLDEVTFKIVNDKNAIATDLRAHLIDADFDLDPGLIETYRALVGYTTATDEPENDELLLFNLADPIMADHRVRQALTMSLDPNQVGAQVYKGSAQPTCDDSGSTWAHEPSLYPCYTFDPAGANDLLDQAGWTDRSPVGCALGQGDCYRAKDGRPLELTFVAGNVALRKQVQALARVAWGKIGIKVDVHYVQGTRQYFGPSGPLCMGRFQIAEVNNSGWQPDPDDSSMFASDATCDKGGGNVMRYANPDVDLAEQTQLNTADLALRKRMFHAIHVDVLKDLPVMYLWMQAEVYCATTRLHNYAPSGIEGPTWNIEDWYLS